MSQVMPPWTALKARKSDRGVDVDVWGRTYRFAGAALPAGIATAGEEILASPMRFVGKVDG
ncbi:MAG: hypothetical protein AB1505_14070 [Candidatus Latescibacterota bacterium]